MTTIQRLGEGYEEYRTIADLPELNALLLFDLIKWAEHDEAFAAKFATWGDWDQSTWGQVMSSLMTDLGLDPTEEADAAKAARNGLCGSAFCMAGQAAVQSGYRLVMAGFSATDCVKEEPTGAVDAKGYEIYRDVPGAPQRGISGVGMEVLGFTHEEASQFFNGDNDLNRIKTLANLFAITRGLPPLCPDAGVAEFFGPNNDEDAETYDDEEWEEGDVDE